MADPKRSATGTKSELNQVNQEAVSLDKTLVKAIGAHVTIKAVDSSGGPVSIEGHIFTACPVTDTVAIASTAAAVKAVPGRAAKSLDYHIVQISCIRSLSIQKLAGNEVPFGTFETALPVVLPSDLRALKAREEAAIRKIKEKDASIGKGVSKEAQEIFDSLARTLPTRWHESCIIVNDAVMIKSPYKPDDCSAPKEQQNALVRVRKVLENERKKLAERSQKGNEMQSSISVRKGG